MRYLFFIIILTATSCNSKFQLKEGDLLFQDLDSSPICDAIELVTPGYQGGNFSHIGLIISDNDTLKVLEAIPPAVTLTNINDFLNRSLDDDKKPKVIVGRLKQKYQATISEAILFSKSKINVKYDDFFVIDNGSYYCSELIYEAFLNDSIFQLQPMNFLDPKNNDTIEAWSKYYKNIGHQIPQNKAGINPGLMSMSSKIQIVHLYGTPDGLINTKISK